MSLTKRLLSLLKQSQTSKQPLINQITPEQLDKVPQYQRKWLEIAQHGTGANFLTIKQAIQNAYHAIALPPPKVIQPFGSPGNLYDAFQNKQDAETVAEQSTRFFFSVALVMVVIWFIGLFFAIFMAFPIVIRWLSNYINLWLFLPAIAIVWWLRRYKKLVNSIDMLGGWLFLGYFVAIAPIAVWLESKQKLLYGLAYATGFISIWAMVWLSQLQIAERWKRKLEQQIRSNLSSPAQRQLSQAFGLDWSKPWQTLGTQIIRATPAGKLRDVPDYCINSWNWIGWCGWVDFCISELSCSSDLKLWHSLQVLVHSCSAVFPRANFCYVSDRPIEIRLDAQQRLHSEGEPAVFFADGTQIYFYQGVLLSADYGKIHPHQWKADWVLSETNAEIRRVLIQGIGYGRLCQELQAQTLDTWREYTLLQIEVPTRGYVNNQEVVEEPIVLLKMTCPSTNHIHVLRVPPNLHSARKAAKWVNWDIDPESFAMET